MHHMEAAPSMLTCKLAGRRMHGRSQMTLQHSGFLLRVGRCRNYTGDVDPKGPLALWSVVNIRGTVSWQNTIVYQQRSIMMCRPRAKNTSWEFITCTAACIDHSDRSCLRFYGNDRPTTAQGSLCSDAQELSGDSGSCMACSLQAEAASSKVQH